MVSLTNKTLTTPSVTNGAVSDVGSSNIEFDFTFPKTYGKSIQGGGGGASFFVATWFATLIEIDEKSKLQNVDVYCNSTVGANAVVSVYLDEEGTPTTRLITSEQVTLTSTKQINSFSFSSDFFFEAGNYWVAIHTSDDFGIDYLVDGSLGAATKYAAPYSYNPNGANVPSSLTDRSWLANVFVNTFVRAPTIENSANEYSNFGITTENTSNFINSANNIVAVEGKRFPGGQVDTFRAFLDPSGTITGDIVAAIYVDGELFAVSTAKSYTAYSFGDSWFDFDFKKIYIPAGNLFLAVTSESTAPFLVNTGTQTSSGRYVSKSKTYDGSFPQRIAVTNISNTLPQIYIVYTRQPENQTSKPSTWKDNTQTWANTTETWGDLVDYTDVTNTT